jgi:hypothetical protein
MSIDSFESPHVFGRPSLFLGGGISGCPDWQAEMVRLLDEMGSDLALINPRAADFDIEDESRTIRQIRWEYQMLRRADGILFWFCKETIQPIVLFELGAHLMVSGKPIFLGVHPEYARRLDVRVQTSLIRPEIQLVDSLQALAEQVITWEADLRRGPPTESAVG